jgi:DNA-binding NtrC family response regulator
LLRSLVEELVRTNAGWRQHMRALLDEQERLEQRQMCLIAAAVQRYELGAAHGEHHFGDLRDMVEEYERTLIVWALASAGGQQKRAAAFLGVGATTLCEKMKRLQIEVPKTHDRLSVHHRPHRRPRAHH